MKKTYEQIDTISKANAENEVEEHRSSYVHIEKKFLILSVCIPFLVWLATSLLVIIDKLDPALIRPASWWLIGIIILAAILVTATIVSRVL